MIYLLMVVIAAIYLGRGPSLLAAVLSVLAFDFFFVPPRLTLAVADTQYLLTFVALLVVSLVISSLTARTREQAEAAEHREAQTAELYALSRDLAVAVDLDAIMQAVLTHVSQTFGREVVILLPDASRNAIQPRALSPGFASERERVGGGHLGVSARSARRAWHRYAAGGQRALPAAQDGSRRGGRVGRETI